METLKKATINQLLNLWDEVSKRKTDQAVADVRGWILEELELRDPDAMDKYYDGFYEDEELRLFFN